MNEESLFAEALGKKGAARAEFLDASCGGDVELRQRLEALLRADDHPDPFLDGVAPRDTVEEPMRERPGTVIGPYKLLEQIGEGGFGVVFMADQSQPVRRKVALKVLKPGMDTRQVVARFEAERQALALMDHPHIAHVFDGGETASGRPYFVMELVRGIPITDFCDQNQFPVRQRLELFVTVCQAVQHAHQKGIIHRDLKPTNLLVTMHDDKAVVKVIDFGIAKATGSQLTEKTLFTNFAQMIGTPMYMSPEQAQMSGLDVDTRSDIYSLGVLLYELLTGTTPFDKERLRTAAYDEIRRIIREEEPMKPSTRFSTLGPAGATVSANRRSDPRRLSQLCRGELDWVAMTCLEKDRTRRYETANALARDVERYLNDEPVQACPPSAVYRFKKFARRNKRALATAALVGLVVLAAVVTVAGTIGWSLRDQEARQAETAARAEAALQEAARMRDQKRWIESRAAVQRADLVLAGSNDHHDLRQRLQDLLTDLDMVDRLERVREAFSDIKGEVFDSVAADLAYESAFRGYDIDVLTLDPVVAAERVRASAIYESLVAALDHWLWLYAQSDASRRALLRRVADLADSDSWRVRFRDPTFLRDRAALEKLATQLDVATTSPTTVFILSRALLDVDAAPKAEEVLTAAQRRHPTDWWLNVQLAITLTKYASPPRFHDAATYARAALAIRPQAAASCTTLANTLQLSNLEESMSLFRRAIELDPDCRISYRALGDMHAGKTEWREAIDYYQQYLSGRTSPYTAASTHVSLANAYRATREPTKAKHELDNAREVLGKAARLKDALVVKDAVEAEALPVAETNCRAVPQWMRPWDAKKWSNGWQLYCSAKQGGFVEFELPALQSRVALAVCFTKAPDYAIVEVAVHGKVVGQSFDGYHPDVAPSGPINLGVLEQYSGAVKIRFTAIDKNPTSSHYRMGIDCLILTPVKGGNKGSQEDD